MNWSVGHFYLVSRDTVTRGAENHFTPINNFEYDFQPVSVTIYWSSCDSIPLKEDVKKNG
jgi:hypothetical protein